MKSCETVGDEKSRKRTARIAQTETTTSIVSPDGTFTSSATRRAISAFLTRRTNLTNGAPNIGTFLILVEAGRPLRLTVNPLFPIVTPAPRGLSA